VPVAVSNVTLSTLDVESPASPGESLASASPLPIVVPTGLPALGEAPLARAWNGLASRPVSTVLGAGQVVAPAAVRVLGAETRFTTFGEPPVETSSTVHRHGIVDPSQLPSAIGRWNRLRRSASAGQVSDLTVTADAAVGVE
jgi:hypothetical protein